MYKFRLATFAAAITLCAQGEAMATCVPCPDIASLNKEIKCGNGCLATYGDWIGNAPEARPGLQLTDDRPVGLRIVDTSGNPQCLYTTNQEKVGFVAENPFLKNCKFPAPKADACGENEFSCS